MTKKENVYTIHFKEDYLEWEEQVKRTGDPWFKRRLEANSRGLAQCKKYSGKTIKLSEIPAFIKEIDECIIMGDDDITVCND